MSTQNDSTEPEKQPEQTNDPPKVSVQTEVKEEQAPRQVLDAGMTNLMTGLLNGFGQAFNQKRRNESEHKSDYDSDYDSEESDESYHSESSESSERFYPKELEQQKMDIFETLAQSHDTLTKIFAGLVRDSRNKNFNSFCANNGCC